MLIEGKPQWEFCCEWYSVEEIQHSIARRLKPMSHLRARGLGDPEPIPTDVRSREFAEWMAHQYRLAMNKGIELAERELTNAG